MRSRTESRDFNGSSPEENITYCFEALRWLYDVCLVDAYGQTVHTPSDGIGAELLPGAVKQLTAHEFGGKTYYSRESYIRFMNAPESTVQPTALPALQELCDQGLNYPQILDHLRANPGLLEDIVFGTLYAFDKFNVVYEPRLFADWGLSFEVSPTTIQVVPFGKLPQIKTAVSFMLANMDRPQVTTRVAVELGILTAENYAHNGEVQLPAEAFDAFDERLQQRNTAPKAIPYLGETLDGAIVDILIKDGLVTPPEGLIRQRIRE